MPDPSPQLDQMARDIVGDAKHPNMFFVSVGHHVILVALDFRVAYSLWQDLSMDRAFETTLEDRQHGVIASVEPADDDDPTLMRLDDSVTFGLQ